MNTIPEICMEFTQVFRTVRFEIFIAFAVGLAFGIIAARLHK
jgi:hypothetical protein